jgi:hypothetical protein
MLGGEASGLAAGSGHGRPAGTDDAILVPWNSSLIRRSKMGTALVEHHGKKRFISPVCGGPGYKKQFAKADLSPDEEMIVADAS